MSLSRNTARLTLFLLFLTAVFAQDAPVDHDARSIHHRDTNALRFARGLPPRPPNKLYYATRTGPTLSRRSAVPLSGVIAAYEIGNPLTPVCYFANFFTCSASPATAWSYAAAVGAGSPNPQNIIALSPISGLPFSLTADLGSSQGPTVIDSDLIVGSDSYAVLGAGAPPTHDPSSENNFETAVWTIASDGTLSAIWVNAPFDPQGPVVPLIFFQRPSAVSIDASANPAYIAAQTGSTLITLKLQLLPP